MKELNLKRKDLVLRMGYVSLNGALRELDRILEGQLLRYDQPLRLAKGLDLDITAVDQAIAETRRQLELAWDEEERRKFKPHIFAICENRMPTQVNTAVFGYRMRFIYLDESFMVLPYHLQLIEAKQKINQHITETRGGVVSFGHFIYFVLRMDYDEELIYLDIRGDLMEKPENARPIGRVSFGFRVGGRRIWL